MTGRKRGVAEVLEDIGEENASSGDETPSKQRKYGTGDSGRCSTQTSQRKYSTKRRFAGNQYTKLKKKSQPASAKKVKGIRKLSSKRMCEGYRLMDMTIFNGFISSVACPKCK